MGNYLANKTPRSHKAMLILQGFNPETGDLETFVEHCERVETTDNIARAKFAASDEDSDTKRKKKRSKFKEREENGKKRHKKQSSLYCSLRGENKFAPPGSENYSKQGIRIETSLSIQQRITGGIPEK